MKPKASFAAALLAFALAAVPAGAASLDAFAGYAALAGGDSGTMHGFQATLGSAGTRRLGFVIDLSGHTGSVADSGDSLDTLALMVGPRFRLGSGRLRPFLHLIGGVVRLKVSLSVFDVEISESSTGFGGAAGGGFDWGFGERWALRLAADYRLADIDDSTVGDPRFSAGVAYRFGGP